MSPRLQLAVGLGVIVVVNRLAYVGRLWWPLAVLADLAYAVALAFIGVGIWRRRRARRSQRSC